MPPFKLKLNTGGTSIAKPSNTPAATPTQTPITASSATRKLKLFSGKTPTAEKPSIAKKPDAPKSTSKAGRERKPSIKIKEASTALGKRTRDESDSEDELANQPLAKIAKPRAKIKLLSNAGQGGATPKTPKYIKPKFVGKPPKRNPGEGYDSEASDREIDPAIEEQFVLRMLPGEDADYVRESINNKTIGVPKALGGADISMKFFDGDGRRAAVTVQGRVYAATLVDMPTITEGLKSFDKKGWLKSADICQMLLCYEQVPSEDMAKKAALPKIIDQKTWQYPHGLTPPMYNARKQRFRKRMSRNFIEATEAEVERLLEADAQAEDVKYEIIDPDAERRKSQFSPGASSPGDYQDGAEYSEDEDAEGEADDQGYFGNGLPDAAEQTMEDDMEGDLEADLLEALAGDAMMEEPVAETPTQVEGTPGASGSYAGTPVAEPEAAQEDSGDESIEDDDDDAEGEDEEEDIDEEEQTRRKELEGAREDIRDLEAQLAEFMQKRDNTPNPILRKRLQDNIDKVKAELQLKKSALGEGDDD